MTEFERMRRFRRQANEMAAARFELMAAAVGMEGIERLMVRAAGNCVCAACGLDYSDHHHLPIGGVCVITCDGRIWKL
jgi:cytochrome P450